MTTVQDDTDKRYLLLKRSEHASLVRDPQTGNECYVQNDRLESVDADDELAPVAQAVSSPVRTLLTTVHDEATLGLLVELADHGPLGVRTILDRTELCESDLHGHLTVLTSADLLTETEVGGERGYRLTETCETALETIRFDSERSSAAEPTKTTETEATETTKTEDTEQTEPATGSETETGTETKTNTGPEAETLLGTDSAETLESN